MRYRYKVVSFLGQNKGNLSAADVAIQLERAVNQHAVDGWEFYELSDVNIEVRPGCIAGLFGASAQYVRFDQLIFRTSDNVDVESAARPISERHNLPASLRKTHSADSQESLEPTPGAQVRADVPGNAVTEKWRKKSDDEVLAAVATINDYTDKHQRVILLEAKRRNLGVGVKSSNVVRDQQNDLTYCYHCGADVAPGIDNCAACGKRL